MERRVCKTVYVGQVPVGGGAPVTVQSMLNTPAHDIPASVEQARRLQAAGCDIIRAGSRRWPMPAGSGGFPSVSG